MLWPGSPSSSGPSTGDPYWVGHRGGCTLTSKQAYQAFLDGIYGPGVVVVTAGDNDSTNFSGAVRHRFEDGGFGFFTSELEARLTRLGGAFPDGPGRTELLTKARNLAEPQNAAGAWCELAAYDFFTGFTAVEPEISVPVGETFASLIPGRQGSSFDGRLPDVRGLKFEVKRFGVLAEVVTSICKEAERLPGVERVFASYPKDLDHAEVTNRRGEFKAGVRTAVDSKLKGYSHPAVPDIVFQIHYGRPKIASTWHEYDPSELQENLRYLSLNHYDQLLLKEPTLLVFVVHPWFNSLQTDFTDQAGFYREFCRRAFHDLATDRKELREVFPKKAAGVTQTIADTVRRLSAILFLEDRSVEPAPWFHPERPRSTLYARVFPNPAVAPENQAADQCREIVDRAVAAGLNAELCSI